MTDTKPTQYYDISGWSPADINTARRAGALADLMAGTTNPTTNTPNEGNN